MKKIFTFILAVILCFGLYGCKSASVPVGVSDSNQSYIGFSLISEEKCLYYCEETKIVYIIFGECGGYDGYGYMSPYYAPNGLPYLYDVNEHTLVEIDKELNPT